jgi:hypothetical protein
MRPCREHNFCCGGGGGLNGIGLYRQQRNIGLEGQAGSDPGHRRQTGGGALPQLLGCHPGPGGGLQGRHPLDVSQATAPGHGPGPRASCSPRKNRTAGTPCKRKIFASTVTAPSKTVRQRGTSRPCWPASPVGWNWIAGIYPAQLFPDAGDAMMPLVRPERLFPRPAGPVPPGAGRAAAGSTPSTG